MDKAGLSPYLKFNEYSRYHTSAMIAAAIETNTLPYRLKHNPITMADTVSKLNWVRSTSLASLSFTVPLPILQNGYISTVETFKNNNQLRPTLDLLDRVSKGSLSQVRIQICVLFAVFIMSYYFRKWMFTVKPLWQEDYHPTCRVKLVI